MLKEPLGVSACNKPPRDTDPARDGALDGIGVCVAVPPVSTSSKPPKPADSYLKIDHLLDIAQKTKAEAIHPGYGLLSENAGFVQTL